MAAGSVSTPTRTTTTTTTTTPAPTKTSPSKPSPSKPTSAKPRPTRDPDSFIGSSQIPTIKNASAIAQAVTGQKDIKGAEAGKAVVRAMHGDLETTASKTTNEIRRDGTHVGSRDARQGILETERAELSKLYAQGSNQREPDHNLRKEMDRIDEELRGSHAMNAVADTLHVLGADDYHVGVLEDEKRVRVVADDELAGSAGYDHELHSILVSQSLADQASKAADALHDQGIMDSRGRIVKGREDDLDASVYGDQLIKIGTLIAYHEQKHGEQDFVGGLGNFATGAKEYVEKGMADFDQVLQGAGELPNANIDVGNYAQSDNAWNLEHLRIHFEEYDAYLAQEQADLQLGASVKIQLVTDKDGNPLERGEAVENILDMERGRSLRHGPDAGWIRDDVLKDMMADAGTDPAEVPWNPQEIAGHAATMVSETPGWKRPGWKRPGWKRPGMLIE